MKKDKLDYYEKELYMNFPIDQYGISIKIGKSKTFTLSPDNTELILTLRGFLQSVECAYTKVYCKNFDEIKEKIGKGIKLYWKQDNYIIYNDDNQYIMRCTNNDNVVGLFHINGIDSEYDPKDIYYYHR